MKDYANTYTEKGRDWLCGSTIANVHGVSLDVRCFTIYIYQLGYMLDLSETRLPFSHNRLLLTIP